MNQILLAGLTIISCIAHAAALTPEDRNSKLCLYAKMGNLSQIQHLLAEGADVNTHSEKHNPKTPLQLASIYGHIEVVTALLAAGARVDATDDHGCTSLHYTTKKEITEQLLATGADVHTLDNKGFTPLHCASIFGKAEVIKLLLARNAAIDACNRNSETPLHIARAEVIEQLVAAGANTNARTKAGLTPLYRASHYGYVDVVTALLAAGASVDAKTDSGRTPLHDACDLSFFRSAIDTKLIAEKLLAAGADVNAQDALGLTPFFIACRSGHTELVSMLLTAGADIDAEAYDGRTALHLASETSNKEIVYMLLEHKAQQLDCQSQRYIDAAKVYLSEPKTAAQSEAITILSGEAASTQVDVNDVGQAQSISAGDSYCNLL
jgi:ankyrin repeat protein